MRHLVELLRGDATGGLDRAALELAAIEFPGLDPQPFLEILDSHAIELNSMLQSESGEEFVEVANNYFFEELGYAGNQEDYYNPRNSCFNEVLASRTGIPISIALVYMEVARRLAKPVYGIGLPGHFICKYDDGDFDCFIDVFNQGRIISVEECIEIAQDIAGVDITETPGSLDPVTDQQIALRMLNNLRVIYLREKTWDKAKQVLDILIEGMPGAAQEYAQRAVIRMELKEFEEARNDLQRYLELDPQSPNSDTVRRQIQVIDNWLGGDS